MAVSDLGLTLKRVGGFEVPYPIYLRSGEMPGFYGVGVVAENKVSGFSVYFGYICFATEGYAEAFSLANRVLVNTTVFPEFVPVQIHHIARSHFAIKSYAKAFCETALGMYEARVLTLGSLIVRKAH